MNNENIIIHLFPMILPQFFMILLYQQAKIQKTDEIIHNRPQFYTLFNNTLSAESPPIALFRSVYCCATAINSTLTNGSRHLVQPSTTFPSGFSVFSLTNRMACKWSGIICSATTFTSGWWLPMVCHICAIASPNGDSSMAVFSEKRWRWHRWHRWHRPIFVIVQRKKYSL